MNQDYLGQTFGLAGRTALVTGGARGLGYAIAAGLGRAGARVVINDLSQAACDAASHGVQRRVRRRIAHQGEEKQAGSDQHDEAEHLIEPAAPGGRVHQSLGFHRECMVAAEPVFGVRVPRRRRAAHHRTTRADLLFHAALCCA